MEKKEELKEDMFVGFNEKGEEMTFYKLLEFDSTETGKHYLAYTDNTTDEKGNLKAYGSVVIKDGENVKLEQLKLKEGKLLKWHLISQEEVNNEEYKNYL